MPFPLAVNIKNAQLACKEWHQMESSRMKNSNCYLEETCFTWLRVFDTDSTTRPYLNDYAHGLQGVWKEKVFSRLKNSNSYLEDTLSTSQWVCNGNFTGYGPKESSLDLQKVALHEGSGKKNSNYYM